MIVPAEGMGTDVEPMRPLLARAVALRASPGVRSTSVFAVQPWLDVPDTGFVVLAVIDGDLDPAPVLDALVGIGREAWHRRADFRADLADLDEAIDRALASPDGPVVLSDSADATGAGSAGDSAAVIAALLERDPQVPCYVQVVAPGAVAAAVAAGVGNRVVTSIGAELDPRWSPPVTVDAEVRTLSSGHFRYRGGKAENLEVCMGRAAVLRVGQVHIVVMERSAETFDPGLYESVGLPPRHAAIVLVRSATQFRDAYRDIASDMVVVDTPGPSTARLERLPWRRVVRPIHPLDDVASCVVRTVVGGSGTVVLGTVQVRGDDDG
jgi:microcystin degradation protein MlrC